ncbi:hypothetical protein ILUMI_14768 [Ignelater luminosus]|uniref:Uncharacterized protein n=1 Tax=Ignelater luminosus TaxID=2038154 RepID=A0A8K0G4I7_IGNLU|nr:hypothetical protein ILUMI_17029 [Ignelater luminosus]KAF2891405.1 hypothetical protein ILUMI_14768 [Ignelater luminosus]
MRVMPLPRNNKLFVTEQLVDLGRDAVLDVQLYKFTSNEYRFFPVFFSANVCAEYKKNSFGIKDLLTRTSNQAPCNLKKGPYYVKNAIPDSSKLPPHLPRGQYKLEATAKYHSFCVYTVELYGKIKDKPVDWKNIPKHNWH